jgi:DNA primase
MAFVDLNDALIAQVRDAADIVEFIQQVTPLKPAGRSYKGLCPFHREKTPSFNVDRARGFFHCFGCGKGGDVFKFLMLAERFTFPEAVEYVAGRVGIDLPRKRKTKEDNEKDDLLEVLDDASEAFNQALKWSPNVAEEYLHKRGVPKEIIERFGFGYAPDSWDYIVRRLSQKHGEKKLEMTGLIMPRKQGGGFYDRFRNRLMIPIHSETGALVGFGGRTLDGSDPKYLNSPEGELFNKSRLLYNLHRSKDQMRRIERAILVEGYFDAIALDHAGIPGVVASMGTSLTSGQASLLRRFAKKVVISYDGDSAGRAAALRAAPILLAAGLSVYILDLEDEKDPDTLIEHHGAGRYLEMLSTAGDVFQFAIKDWAADVASLSGREKSERVEMFMPLLSAVTDPVERNDAAQRIANAFQLEFEVVWSRVKGKVVIAPEERVTSAGGATAEKMLLLAAVQGRLTDEKAGRIRPEFFDDASCKAIYSIIYPDVVDGKPIDFRQIATHLRGETELTLLSELSLSEDLDDLTLARIDENLEPMERLFLERRRVQIQREISEAERSGDDTRLSQLLAEKQELLSMSRTMK